MSFAQIAAATQEVKTNVNEVSDFFAKEIADQESLKEFLNNSKEQATEAMKSKSALSELQISEGDATNKAAELNNIHVNDLEHQGRLERGKEENSYLNSLEIDYSSPLIAEHKKDGELIADASSKLLTRLVEGLKEFGIDCQQGLGNSQQEAEYHIEINKQPAKDTIYNQVTCEELIARTYQCHDGLSVRCLRQGQRYGNWQDQQIALDGRMLYQNFIDWGWSVKWEHKHHGWYIHKNHPPAFFGMRISESNLTAQQINDQARMFIITTLGVNSEQIHEVINFPEGGQGIGLVTPLYSRWRDAWAQYVFRYKYREIFNVCEQWQEEWEEQCLVK